MSSVSIAVADPWTGSFDEREPVRAVGDGHVHARLTLRVAGRPLPGLGFFGPDDVCLDHWLAAFCELRETFEGRASAECVIDDHEQGSPEYRFRREGARVFVSVIPYGSSQPDPGFHDVECLTADLFTEIDAALGAIEALAIREGGDAGELWWRDLAMGAHLDRDRVLQVSSADEEE